MKNETTPSQEMRAINGPTQEIENLQTELSAILADVLQRRNAVKNFFSQEAEEEIERICASFTAANRRIISQRMLNSYCHNRYPIPQKVIPIDAPVNTKELMEK